MGSESQAPEERTWGDVLVDLDMTCYYDKLVDAAIESPSTLAAMGHEDALAILKELDVLAGHRHRLLRACVALGSSESIECACV